VKKFSNPGGAFTHIPSGYGHAPFHCTLLPLCDTMRNVTQAQRWRVTSLVSRMMK